MSVRRDNYSVFKYYTLLYFKISSIPKRMEILQLENGKKYLTAYRASHKHDSREEELSMSVSCTLKTST